MNDLQAELETYAADIAGGNWRDYVPGDDNSEPHHEPYAVLHIVDVNRNSYGVILVIGAGGPNVEINTRDQKVTAAAMPSAPTAAAKNSASASSDRHLQSLTRGRASRFAIPPARPRSAIPPSNSANRVFRQAYNPPVCALRSLRLRRGTKSGLPSAPIPASRQIFPGFPGRRATPGTPETTTITRCAMSLTASIAAIKSVAVPQNPAHDVASNSASDNSRCSFLSLANADRVVSQPTNDTGNACSPAQSSRLQTGKRLHARASPLKATYPHLKRQQTQPNAKRN